MDFLSLMKTLYKFRKCVMFRSSISLFSFSPVYPLFFFFPLFLSLSLYRKANHNKYQKYRFYTLQIWIEYRIFKQLVVAFVSKNSTSRMWNNRKRSCKLFSKMGSIRRYKTLNFPYNILQIGFQRGFSTIDSYSDHGRTQE